MVYGEFASSGKVDIASPLVAFEIKPELIKSAPIDNLLGFKKPISLSAGAALISQITQRSFPNIYKQVSRLSNTFSSEIPLAHLPQILVDKILGQALPDDSVPRLRQMITDHHLSSDDFTLLLLSSRGLTSLEISPMLGQAPKSVRNLASTIKRRLDQRVENKTQLIGSQAFKPLLEPKLFPQLQVHRLRLLTPRQLTVLSLLTRQTRISVAQELGIKAKTIRTHVYAILESLDCPNQTAAITLFLLAQKQGLI